VSLNVNKKRFSTVKHCLEFIEFFFFMCSLFSLKQVMCNSLNEKINKKMIEFVGIFVYFIIALALSLILVGVSFVFATKKSDPEKISAYECGFDPFDDARSRFDIQFYLVAILFIIFDLEVTFLFPWALTLNQVGFFGFWSMMIFLIILTYDLYTFRTICNS